MAATKLAAAPFFVFVSVCPVNSLHRFRTSIASQASDNDIILGCGESRGFDHIWRSCMFSACIRRLVLGLSLSGSLLAVARPAHLPKPAPTDVALKSCASYDQPGIAVVEEHLKTSVQL